MTTPRTSRQLALDLQRALNDYVKTKEGKKLSIKRYKRLSSRILGMTYDQIAEEEGVSQSAVAYQVHKDVEMLLKFAGVNHKRIVNKRG